MYHALWKCGSLRRFELASLQLFGTRCAALRPHWPGAGVCAECVGSIWSHLQRFSLTRCAGPLSSTRPGARRMTNTPGQCGLACLLERQRIGALAVLVLDAVVVAVLEEVDHVVDRRVTCEDLQFVDCDHAVVVEVEGSEIPVLVAEQVV
jgi:hypothetical protein